MRVGRLPNRGTIDSSGLQPGFRDLVLSATAEGASARGAAERFGIGIKTAIGFAGRARKWLRCSRGEIPDHRF
jgi:hypothetical protein